MEAKIWTHKNAYMQFGEKWENLILLFWLLHSLQKTLSDLWAVSKCWLLKTSTQNVQHDFIDFW